MAGKVSAFATISLNTMHIGHSVIFREKVSSTNDLAESLIRDGEGSDGMVIYSHEQVSGRGQPGNEWEGEPGMNLTMSIILRPNFLHPEKQFLISKVISLALSDLLTNLAVEIKIKWPNDIYARGDKIAGILIENSLSGNIIDYSIAGIGLNVNQVNFKSGAPNPVSLRNITGETYQVDKLIMELCTHLNWWYTRLRDGDHSTIDGEYRGLLYRLDEQATYMVSGLRIQGTIRGVDRFGHLLVEDEGGTIRKFAFREIVFIP